MLELIVPLFDVKQITELFNAGANALTFSCAFFATKENSYFTRDDFTHAVKCCHELGIKAYTFVNRIFVEEELEQLDEYMKWLKVVDIDGIYYCDHAVYIAAKKYDLISRLVFCQDTVLTNSSDIEAYLSSGIKRCVISCDITLEEIVEIVDINYDCELMIHGHLNLADSKRKLLQAYSDEIMVDNKAGIYTIIEESREQKMYIFEDGQGTHVFTSECLQMVKELPLLLNKIKAFRISGLFSSYEEVLVAVSNYAAIIKGIDATEIYEDWILQDEQKYTSGYLYRKTNLVK